MKLLRWLWTNFPFILAMGLAIFCAWYQYYNGMGFFLIMAGLFIVLRELTDVKDLLNQILEWGESEEPEEPDTYGRHHV